MEAVIDALVAHAYANYETGGWDVLIECYDRKDMAEELTVQNITTTGEAIEYYAIVLGAHDEMRQDIEGEAF